MRDLLIIYSDRSDSDSESELESETDGSESSQSFYKRKLAASSDIIASGSKTPSLRAFVRKKLN